MTLFIVLLEELCIEAEYSSQRVDNPDIIVAYSFAKIRTEACWIIALLE
jgi:hypothetical protein